MVAIQTQSSTGWGKKVLKELATRHSDLAHSLKSGLNHNTLRFPAIVTPPGAQVSSRRAPAVQPRRLSKTSKLENLLMSDPSRVKVFRKIIDRQSGKPLYKLTKFKIVCVTDHTYVTDTGKVYRKNHICLKPNYRSTVSVAPNTLGDRLQSSNSTSRGAVKGPATRFQPVPLEQRPNNPTLATPMADLTVDSSSENSVGSNGGLQVINGSSPIGKRQRLQCDSPPVRFAPQSNSTSQLHTSTSATCSLPTDSTAQLESLLTSPQPRTSHCAASSSTVHLADFPGVNPTRTGIIISSPDLVSPQGLVLPSHSASSELPSSYPSLSLPAQPVVDDAESVRTSHRSKKPTQFFGDPLRRSVKSVEEDPTLPSETVIVSSSSPRKPLIRDRFPPGPSTTTSPPLAHAKDVTGKD